jgi:hypothetical protein
VPGFFISGATLLRPLHRKIPGMPYFYWRYSAVCPVMHRGDADDGYACLDEVCCAHTLSKLQPRSRDNTGRLLRVTLPRRAKKNARA